MTAAPCTLGHVGVLWEGDSTINEMQMYMVVYMSVVSFYASIFKMIYHINAHAITGACKL